jgi:hypothetical protein
MSKTMKSYQEPSREEIAFCAYGIYESEGRPHGKEQEHWLQAEAQLIAERKAQARQSTAKSAPKAAPATLTARPVPAATAPPALPGKAARP